MMRTRRLSSAVWIWPSATMTCSSVLATSASAWTMSIGAIVPSSTFFWLFLSEVCASSSDFCATSSWPIALTRV